MLIGSVIIGVIGFGNLLIGNFVEKKVVWVIQKVVDENNVCQQMVYNNVCNDLGGYLFIGQNVLMGFNVLVGGDYSGFQNSFDYQFVLSQGLQGVDWFVVVWGVFYLGGQQVDFNDYVQGMVFQNLGNYCNNLFLLVGMGQNVVGMIVGVGQNIVNVQGQNIWGVVNVQGNLVMNQVGNWNQFLVGIGGEVNKVWQGWQLLFGGNSLLGKQVSIGVGSLYNFGNNINNLVNWGCV